MSSTGARVLLDDALDSRDDRNSLGTARARRSTAAVADNRSRLGTFTFWDECRVGRAEAVELGIENQTDTRLIVGFKGRKLERVGDR